MSEGVLVALIGLAGVGAGALLPRVMDWRTARKEKKAADSVEFRRIDLDEVRALRSEVRTQSERFATRMDALEAEVDQWRLKYWALFREHQHTLTELDGYKGRYVELVQKYTALSHEVEAIRGHVNGSGLMSIPQPPDRKDPVDG